MCRNVKRLRQPDRVPTDQELGDAALQYVRKISGFRAPSKANTQAFETAVTDVTAAGRRLFEGLRPAASDPSASGSGAGDVVPQRP